MPGIASKFIWSLKEEQSPIFKYFKDQHTSTTDEYAFLLIIFRWLYILQQRKTVRLLMASALVSIKDEIYL